MRARMVLMAGVLMASTGCAIAALKHQAALDHGCSEDRITVGRAPDDRGRPTEVNVCGKVRRYRMMSGDLLDPVWLDVTELGPGSGRPPE